MRCAALCWAGLCCAACSLMLAPGRLTRVVPRLGLQHLSACQPLTKAMHRVCCSEERRCQLCMACSCSCWDLVCAMCMCPAGSRQGPDRARGACRRQALPWAAPIHCIIAAAFAEGMLNAAQRLQEEMGAELAPGRPQSLSTSLSTALACPSIQQEQSCVLPGVCLTACPVLRRSC